MTVFKNLQVEYEKAKQDACDHNPAFDEEAALKIADPWEVRRRWPRFSGECTKCGFNGVAYASFVHYIAGDW